MLFTSKLTKSKAQRDTVMTQAEMHIGDDVIAPSPRLPPELEREIFELAARIDRAVCRSLLVVSKRVYLWIEPLLYETIIQDKRSGKEATFPLPEGKSRYVRNLLLGGTVDWSSTDEILRDCPNITNLAVWCRTTPDCLDIIKNLPLKRLSANFHALTPPPPPPLITHLIGPQVGLGLGFGFGGAPTFSVETYTTPYPFSHFQTLTHLELTNFCGEWELCSELSMVPGLTHLAFNYQVPLDVLNGALDECRVLEVLVSTTFHYTTANIRRGSVEDGGGDGGLKVEQGNGIVECKEMALFAGITDMRVVYLSQPAKEVLRDWEREVYGEMSFWRVAENIVARRKRKAGVR
ncbi:hypothetical protein BDN72DRAFT_833579 [Pluteus cervinus]|uniref:Uncharacterized protein n=1 Tax=Pluteus cervinus TaxID=181527 RepID=A0ACD3B827_9AGAR|nr:hypothetical protein BDN72DRAFT_833579 [Pluteus cervinus]